MSVIHAAAAVVVTVCGLSFADAASAQASASAGSFADPAMRHHDGARLTMYWQLPIDGLRAARPSYGLRLDSSPLQSTSLGRLPLIDFRMRSQRATVLLTGVPVARMSDSSDSGGGWDSLTDPSRPWLWAGVGALALGVSCATHNWPCRRSDSSSSGYTAPGG